MLGDNDGLILGDTLTLGLMEGDIDGETEGDRLGDTLGLREGLTLMEGDTLGEIEEL